VNLDAGVAPPVECQEARQDRLDRLGGGADPDHAGVPTLEGARPLAQRLGVGQQAAAPPEQILAFRRELHAPPDPIEELHAQRGLERPDLA
jgi:hypothetical protein